MSLGFRHTTIFQYFYYDENTFLYNTLLQRSRVKHLSEKCQKYLVWQFWALLPCFFFRWKIDWNWPFLV